MKFSRSSKCHFNKYLTTEKKNKIKVLLKEYARIVNYFIETYEKEILEQEKPKKLNYLYASYIQEGISYCNSWLSARMVKNAFAEAFGMIMSAKEVAKALKRKYFRPKHYGKKAILSQTIASVDLEPSLVEFDMIVSFTSLGNKEKIQVPLKKHKQFNKWLALGTLNNSIVLSSNYIQFSFTIEVDKKKKEGEYLGVDVGVKKLITLSNGEFRGNDFYSLLEKLDRKKQNSKSFKRTKKEIEHYIDKTINELPWESMSFIIVEKLKNLKKNMKVKRRLTKKTRRFVSRWNYRYLLSRIQLRSKENRVSFRSVPAYYTSTTCPSCNHRDKKNRLSQEHFLCQSCGYSGNADIVGAKNVLNRFIMGAYCPH